jgi:predicted HAD superfamily Cof-like phosphohydrolase
MINPIKQIYQFNQQAGLLDKPYDDFLESSMLIEEALEGFSTDILSTLLLEKDKSPKAVSRKIIWHTCGVKMELVDRLDKQCDAAIIAIGGMAKLGLNPQQITEALNIVMRANFAKLANTTLDEHGKICKPDNFVGPEAELQKLLDKL